MSSKILMDSMEVNSTLQNILAYIVLCSHLPKIVHSSSHCIHNIVYCVHMPASRTYYSIVRLFCMETVAIKYFQNIALENIFLQSLHQPTE